MAQLALHRDARERPRRRSLRRARRRRTTSDNSPDAHPESIPRDARRQHGGKTGDHLQPAGRPRTQVTSVVQAPDDAARCDDARDQQPAEDDAATSTLRADERTRTQRRPRARTASTSACSVTTIITFERALATRFQTKLDRFPNIGEAEITASSHGGTSNVFAATTAAKPPSIRLNAQPAACTRSAARTGNCARRPAVIRGPRGDVEERASISVKRSVG